MIPLMVNGRGKGWPRSVQVFVQIVWTLNPEWVMFSGCGKDVMVSPSAEVRIGCSCRWPFPTDLSMDVFVAVCFYPPDPYFVLVMVLVTLVIKEWSCFVYVPACFLLRFSPWLLAICLNLEEVTVGSATSSDEEDRRKQ